MADKATPEQETTESLRAVLFDTIRQLRAGKIGTSEAQSVSKLAEAIIKTADLEMKWAHTLSQLDKDGQGVSPGKVLLVSKSGG